MESFGGWQFWVEDGDRVRQFVVAEPDEIKARQCLRKNQPKGQIHSSRRRDLNWLTSKVPSRRRIASIA